MRWVRSWQHCLWPAQQLITAAPKEFSLLFVLLLFQGLIPGISLLLMKKMIHWVEVHNETSIVLLPVSLVAAWGGMLLLELGTAPFVSMARMHLNEKALAHFNVLLMQKANSLETLQPFEDSQLYDEIQFLREEAKRKPLNFVYVIASFFKDIVALLSIAFALSSLNVFLALLIVLAGLPHAISTMLLEKQGWDQMLFRSPEARKMAWLSALTLDEKSSKEIRLFDIGNYIIARYRELASSFHNLFGSRRMSMAIRSTALSLCTAVSNLAILCWIIFEAKQGRLELGATVISVQALIVSRIQISNFTQNLAMLKPILGFFNKFKSFLSKEIAFSYPQFEEKKMISDLKHAIVFEDVSFKYHDGRQALMGINLKIHVGEKIALVGENGAGKTTLIKLLLGFYLPSSGRILIDGVDLREIDMHSWRKLLSAVFQDFCKYHFSIQENITLSNLAFAQDMPSLYEAAHKGGFDQVIQKLPLGYETMLGKEFGGISLSEGEWQKLAMSRAFMRKAKLFIFDEPTASLDPKSECAAFDKFAANVGGKTAIFITHRLGSATMADRIIVLKDGQIVKQGHHEELLDTCSEYSEMFLAQANLYS